MGEDDGESYGPEKVGVGEEEYKGGGTGERTEVEKMGYE